MWLSSLVVSCASTQLDVEGVQSLSTERPLYVLPFINASESPRAGEKVQALLVTMLRAQSGQELQLVLDEDSEGGLPQLDDDRRVARALSGLRERGPGWAFSGTVVEWTYRPGLDDHPAVSLSLRVLDVEDGRVVWSASASSDGRGSLGGLAQSLLKQMVKAIPFSRGN